MLNKPDEVESKSTSTPLQPPKEEQPGTGRGNTAKSKHTAAVDRFIGVVEKGQAEFQVLKAQLAIKEKELKILGVKLGNPIPLAKPPFSEEMVEKVEQLLTETGMNVKSFQKGLGVFDVAELTRLRRALVVAGVTRETENYNGSNATFIELDPEFATATEGDPE